jgi:hypothetical protein
MSHVDIEAIRREHHRDGIGPWIYSLLKEVVASTAVRYPAQIYSASSTWDEGALSELLHDWIVERLMRGDLSLMITSSASTQRLRGQLSTSLKQLIINRRRRDSAGNLYRRTLAILKADDRFVQVTPGSPHHSLWSLAEERESLESPLDLRALAKLAFELSDDELKVVRYGPRTLKSSPILREPELERFLVHLLGGAGGALTPTRIAQVMQYRFALVRERQVALEEQLASSALVDLRVESDDLVEIALGQLDGAELDRVRALVESDWNATVAAEASGEAESAMRLAASRLGALAAEHAEGEEQAVEIVNRVCESLFIQDA